MTGREDASNKMDYYDFRDQVTSHDIESWLWFMDTDLYETIVHRMFEDYKSGKIAYDEIKSEGYWCLTFRD